MSKFYYDNNHETNIQNEFFLKLLDVNNIIRKGTIYFINTYNIRFYQKDNNISVLPFFFNNKRP